MSDARIADAITVFKASPTGAGARAIGGSKAIQSYYGILAKLVADKLSLLHARGKITFEKMQWDITTPGHKDVVLGNSDNKFSSIIWINKELEPAVVPTVYPSLGDQCKLGFTSLSMVHEAVHHVMDFKDTLLEEMTCRTLELLYYQDLKVGQSYLSSYVSARCMCQVQPAGPRTTYLTNQMNGQLGWFQSDQLIDFILRSHRYREMVTPGWVVKNLSDWGGPRNRQPQTKGIYMEVLMPKAWKTYLESGAILDILDSIQDPVEYSQTGAIASDLKTALEFSRLDAARVKRIRAIQTKLKIDLGVK
jgi:hypothetical protein